MDVGGSITQIVPVYDGYGIPHAIQKTKLGGRDITEYLQLLLRQRGNATMISTSEFEITKELKEALCFVRRKDEDTISLEQTADNKSCATNYQV